MFRVKVCNKGVRLYIVHCTLYRLECTVFRVLFTCVCVHFTSQEAQLNEVLSASNLDPSALTMVTRKLEVRMTLAGWCCISSLDVGFGVYKVVFGVIMSRQKARQQ